MRFWGLSIEVVLCLHICVSCVWLCPVETILHGSWGQYVPAGAFPLFPRLLLLHLSHQVEYQFICITRTPSLTFGKVRYRREEHVLIRETNISFSNQNDLTGKLSLLSNGITSLFSCLFLSVQDPFLLLSVTEVFFAFRKTQPPYSTWSRWL